MLRGSSGGQKPETGPRDGAAFGGPLGPRPCLHQLLEAALLAHSRTLPPSSQPADSRLPAELCSILTFSFYDFDPPASSSKDM